MNKIFNCDLEKLADIPVKEIVDNFVSIEYDSFHYDKMKKGFQIYSYLMMKK